MADPTVPLRVAGMRALWIVGGTAYAPPVDGQMVAGEPVEVLLEALRQLTRKKTRTGMLRVSASLDREIGDPLCRALARIERELRDADRVGRRGMNERTPEQRRADALVALAVRLAEVETAT